MEKNFLNFFKHIDLNLQKPTFGLPDRSLFKKLFHPDTAIALLVLLFFIRIANNLFPFLKFSYQWVSAEKDLPRNG
jgi:hypothetical protein